MCTLAGSGLVTTTSPRTSAFGVSKCPHVRKLHGVAEEQSACCSTTEPMPMRRIVHPDVYAKQPLRRMAVDRSRTLCVARDALDAREGRLIPGEDRRRPAICKRVAVSSDRYVVDRTGGPAYPVSSWKSASRPAMAPSRTSASFDASTRRMCMRSSVWDRIQCMTTSSRRTRRRHAAGSRVAAPRTK